MNKQSIQNKKNIAKIFGASIEFDKQLYKYDILGTIAHVKALKKCNIILDHELKIILNGLLKIEKKIENGLLNFSKEYEDVHMNIEYMLYNEIGELAGKIHTGRSRNDQISLDLHLYAKHEILNIINMLYELQKNIFKQAIKHNETFISGYTHLQRAIPVRLSHHLLAYFFMFQRDIEKLKQNWEESNTMPLGSGALAGSGYNIDRKYLAKILNFKKIYENSMDAVSNRDFIISIISSISLIIMHLSRISEELILWSTSEFNFVKIKKEHCTSSSMMPQKQNPDTIELIRGKTGKIYGSLIGILTVMKSLPLTYNKDMQEDKELLFSSIETIKNALNMYSKIIATLEFNSEFMSHSIKNSFTESTQLANYLTQKKIPFRKAYILVKKIILYCIKNNKNLHNISLEEYKKFYKNIDNNVYECLKTENVIESHKTEGSTSIKSITKQIEIVKKYLQNTKKFLNKK